MDINARQTRIIRLWLLCVAALIFIMVLVGGATRLTESGLSIVEWKPVTGAVPPLTAEHWQDAFDAYKTIPQYRELNSGMTLDEFKTIYYWEWSHRFLGRLIGAAFLLPFLFFLWRGWLGDVQRRLWAIFALGALQGAVGWWMVASGLSERLEVSQYRLATHLMLAVAIYAAIVWTWLRMRPRAEVFVAARYRIVAGILVAAIFVQLYLGALVAGLRAGRLYNTWPLIDGALVPESARLFFEQPLWRNFFENALTVQFNHRMLAYGLWLLAAWHLVDTLRSRASSAVVKGALALLILMTVQAGLGVLTLLHMVPISLALAHQGMALVVLTVALVHAERLSPRLARQTVAFNDALKAQAPATR